MPVARSKKAGAEVETRRFGMHPKLLLDVIRRQAGTLPKAILEGVMNSIDAGCRKCEVTITDKVVTITDDGKGIAERRHVEQFFETFGQPHDESEGKTYGTFRMGRGQMFAFGHNVWTTGPFVMLVDVKEKGLDYELRTEKKAAAGCTIVITLYDPLLPSDLAEVERTIRKWVQFAPATVLINGKAANTDPAKEKWDHVTDEAYVKLTRGNGALTIYNLGVHTMDLGGYRFGTGGLIVSRKQLKVNFARNDIQSDCPVWRKIKPLVDQKAREKVKAKSELTDDERQRLCNLVAEEDYPDKAYELRLFTAVNGRHFSAKQLYDDNHKYGRKLTVCKKGDLRGDRVFQGKLAFVLAQETLDRFDMSAEEVVRLLGTLQRHDRGRDFGSDYRAYDVVDFDSIAAGISVKHNLVPEAEVTPLERIWRDLAQRGAWLLRRRMDMAFEAEMEEDDSYDYEPGNDTRKVVVGDSEGCDGWTDGETFVAIDRSFLKTLTFDARGLTDLGLLLLHELCHDGPDTAEHVHGHEFYELFHNRAWHELPGFVQGCLHRLPNVFKTAGRELPKALLKNADQREQTLRGLRGLLKSAEALPKE